MLLFALIGEVCRLSIGALCENLSYLSSDALLSLACILLLFLHAKLHFIWGLHLFNDDDFETEFDQLINISVETFLWEARMHLCAHPLQI